VGTDKKAGLHVYDLSGRTLFSETSGLINNVDLAELPDGRVIVVASDRNPANARLRVWQMDKASGALTLLATTPGGTGEGYGFCLRHDGAALRAFSALKDGTVEEYRLTFPGGDEVRSEPLRTRRIPTQIEGCVADPRDGTLYVGEEGGGLWRFGAEDTLGELVVPIDNRYLVADLE